jgi:peptidoglycan/LPS O-acetylase OafA/YrhL
LIVAVIVTILVSAPSSTLSLASYFTRDMTWTYLWQTSLGISGTLPLPGVFTTNPFPGAANGSLWTLPIEIRCYLGILLAGSVGLLRSPRIALVVGLLIITACVYAPWPVSLVLESVNIRKLAIIFTCGALAYVWRERIPLSLIGGVAAAWAYLTIPAGFVRAVATLPLITYASLAFAYHPRLRIRRLANGADFSYGLYVFAFPIQQLFLWRWPHIGIGGLFLAATPVIAAVAALSWYCVEGPALAMKGRFLRRQARSPSA